VAEARYDDLLTDGKTANRELPEATATAMPATLAVDLRIVALYDPGRDRLLRSQGPAEVL
jgi:hypothetical protein